METMPSLPQAPRTITILIVGDSKVGKTTFLSRISQRGSLEGTVSIGMLHDEDQPFVFQARRGPKEFRLEFFDTAAPVGWQNLDPDLVIVCYDISQRMTLIDMQRAWSKQVMAVFKKDTLPVAVLGLKRDLRSETDPNGIIYPEEGTRVAQEMRADSYMECSAITGELLDLVVKDIFSMALKTTTDTGGQSEGGCSTM
ncbi:putative rho-like small protein [Zalerion maritima]|uniref:Rho-like small protein n=1 Tax=Zalerion maritima TaxID=339359 RepID=A0AAD5WNZ0_9PEZI|nr:putative rho-like small protein [Zalerion maritima]